VFLKYLLCVIATTSAFPLLDQDLPSFRKTKLAVSMTCTSERTHFCILFCIHGKHSERVFNTEEAQAVLGLLLKESAVKLVNGV
ncbi:unnamed protein product, partial [Bubo scandiacus]